VFVPYVELHAHTAFSFLDGASSPAELAAAAAEAGHEAMAVTDHNGVSGSMEFAVAAAPLAMNDIQVVGSHNSYKAQIPAAVMAKIRAAEPKLAEGLDYYHLPLARQLDAGVRQLEIDIFADPTGGRYANPKGEEWVRAAGAHSGFDRAAMLKPGYKVFHVPDVDYLSGCVTLVRCLREIDSWSRAHPRHLPIMITINAADTPSDRPGISSPLPLDNAALLDALDAEIRSVLAPARLITPDEVRGANASLRDAVRSKGWPTLDAARGRIFILFDVRWSRRCAAAQPPSDGKASRPRRPWGRARRAGGFQGIADHRRSGQGNRMARELRLRCA
jgi:hypothetical protein